MTALNVWVKRVDAVYARLHGAEWIPQFLMRVFLGYFFCESGWGKIHNLDTFTQRFTDWGIPFPAFNAALSAYTEFLGGALIVLGLGTRLVAIPMVINMIVAVLSVKLKELEGVNAFFELDEPLYALGFFWLIFSGPGWVSLDHLIAKAFKKAEPEASPNERTAPPTDSGPAMTPTSRPQP
jgi:putative oxidoreductase